MGKLCCVAGSVGTGSWGVCSGRQLTGFGALETSSTYSKNQYTVNCKMLITKLCEIRLTV